MFTGFKMFDSIFWIWWKKYSVNTYIYIHILIHRYKVAKNRLYLGSTKLCTTILRIHIFNIHTTMSFFSVFWPILSPCRVEVPFLVHNYHRDTIRKPTTISRPSNCNDLSALKVAAKEKMDYPTSKYDYSPFISTIRCFLLFPLSTTTTRLFYYTL